MHTPIPSLNLLEYVEGFDKLDEQGRRYRANLLINDLIMIYYNRVNFDPSLVKLTEQQIVNFLSIFSYIVFLESEINKQINDLGHAFSLNANGRNFLQRYDSSVVDPIYDLYLRYKSNKIVSKSPDSGALFVIYDKWRCYNYFNCRHSAFGNENYVKQYFDFAVDSIFFNFRACQVSRLIGFINVIDYFFLHIVKPHGYDLLDKYPDKQSLLLQLNALLSILPIEYKIQTTGALFFHFAFVCNDAELFFKCLNLGGKIEILSPIEQRKALTLAITQSHKGLLSKLVAKGIVPQENDLKNASEVIVKFLNYKPARDRVTLRELFLHSVCTQSLLERYVEDEADTSDEDSSDDEIDSFQVVNPGLTPSVDKTLVSRGVNYYAGNFFDTAKRRSSRQLEFHRQTVNSRGTQDLIGKPVPPGQSLITAARADELVKGYFELLKLTPDKPEMDKDLRRRTERSRDGKIAIFDTLYFRFIQAYVQSYNDLFNNNAMHRNFNFFSSHNPTLSTTKKFKVACCYASGDWINHCEKSLPKYRRSAGFLKHRRLGYVEVYLIPAAYYSKYAVEIDQLYADKKIGLGHNYRYGQEVVIESSIPAEYILGFQIFSLPKMKDEWTPRIQQHYGLTRDKYNTYRDRLLLTTDKNDVSAVLEELIKAVTESQAGQLENTIKSLIRPLPAVTTTSTLDEVTSDLSKLGIRSAT